MNAADEIIGRGRALAGDDVAAVIEPNRTVTYRELDRLVNRYGNAMLASGVGRENRVLLMLDDGVDFVACYLAAIRIGAVAVAINLRASAADLKAVFEEARPRFFLVERDLLEVYETIESQLDYRPRLVVSRPRDGTRASIDDLIGGCSDRLVSAAMSPDDMACWVYSSGTTGTPKAVVHLHHDLLEADRHQVENLGVRPRDRLFCSSKMFFAYALGNAFFGGLRAGATVIVNRGWPAADEVARVVETHRPDYFFTVPTFYRSLIAERVAERGAFRSLRGCVSAGEGLPACVLKAWHEMTGQPIFEGIGTSETLFLVIANHPRAWRAGCTGRTQPWVEAKLLDENGVAIVEPDTPGALWLRTASVADRYWNRQALSRQTFVGDWYVTGDVFSVGADAWWRHHGRRDSMLKISGQWVSPLEIEERACTADGVADAAVVGRSDGDGLVRTTMFVVPSYPQTDEVRFRKHLLEHLRAGLAIYKCPRDIRLVEVLPRTVTGKIQRHVLREWIEAGNDDRRKP